MADAVMIDASAPAVQRLLDVGDEPWNDFYEEINNLMVQEKKCRQENDTFKGSELCCKILQMAYDKKDYVHLKQWLVLLVKRRAQAKRATTDMINLCMNTFLDKLPSTEERMAMLATLREASEGKIFLEREYANCTRMQVEMLEAEGKIDEAAKVIQEIAIETYGSVESKEKVNFILY